MRVGPQLVVPRRAVHDHDIGAIGRGSCRRRRHESEPGRALGPVAEGGGGELATTGDEMLIGVDRVMHVVGERRDGLPDAGAVRAVPHAARHPGDQRPLDLFLQVEHRRVFLAAQRTPERPELAPGRRREEMVPPVSQCDGNDAPDARVQFDQRHESGLGHPVDRQIRTVRPDVGDERERVDDVAERRWAHDQDRAHAMVPVYQRRGETP